LVGGNFGLDIAEPLRTFEGLGKCMRIFPLSQPKFCPLSSTVLVGSTSIRSFGNLRRNRIDLMHRVMFYEAQHRHGDSSENDATGLE
jgi:hypothetical protein